jgi:hypothetical protein
MAERTHCGDEAVNAQKKGSEYALGTASRVLQNRAVTENFGRRGSHEYQKATTGMTPLRQAPGERRYKPASNGR